MKNHNHPFVIGEKVYDDYKKEWAVVSMFKGVPNEAGCLVLKNDAGEIWEANYRNVYQIAPNLRTACSGDVVCYEHNETEDGYPYYCPELQENFFSIELVQTFDEELKEGSGYELVQNLQGAILSSGQVSVPVFVEDENGRLENITHIWYDPTRQMIRLTVGGVEFTDSEEE
jgi:hypothetical protein